MAEAKITYQTDMHAYLTQFAKHGADSLDAAIRKYNASVAEVEALEANRLKLRSEFIPADAERRYDDWLNSMRSKFAREAAQAFDAIHTPLELPARLELSEAKRYADAAARASKRTGRAA